MPEKIGTSDKFHDASTCCSQIKRNYRRSLLREYLQCIQPSLARYELEDPFLQVPQPEDYTYDALIYLSQIELPGNSIPFKRRNKVSANESVIPET